MIRGLVVAACGAVIVVAGLTGCSSKDKSGTSTGGESGAATTSGGSASGTAAAAGTATVTIDGKPKDISGQVVCSTVGGNFNIAVGETGTGVAVAMAPDASKVMSVGLGNVNGAALGFQDGMPGGNASATKDGNTYTINGTATGVDLANPMQPMTKPFEIRVTCP